MKPHEATLGTEVETNQGLYGLPAGARGVIVNHYTIGSSEGVDVKWTDIPIGGDESLIGHTDGFSFARDLDMLDVVVQHIILTLPEGCRMPQHNDDWGTDGTTIGVKLKSRNPSAKHQWGQFLGITDKYMVAVRKEGTDPFAPLTADNMLMLEYENEAAMKRVWVLD